MRRIPVHNVIAPSTSLLRFLRIQSEDVCFFTSNSRATISQRPHPTLSRRSLNLLPPSRRHLNTTLHPKAVVESSHFSLDALKGVCARDSPLHQAIPSFPKRLWPWISGENKSISSAPRHASTDSRPLLRKIWGRRRHGVDANSDELPPLSSLLADVGGTALGRSKAAKGSNELKLRCTEFNEDGKVTLVNGEFKKTELIAKV